MDDWELCLGPATVRSGCWMRITAEVPIDFQPESLLIDRDVAGDFLVTDLKFDHDSVLISTGALPGLLFSDDALIERFHLDPLKKGARVSISVTCQSKEDRVFRGKLRGTRGTRVRDGMRRYALGFGSTLVKHNGSANINVEPQLAFNPDRLVVPSTIRDGFKIREISFRNGSTREVLDPEMHLGSFTENSVGQLTFGRELVPGQYLTISVDNVSASDLNFQAAVLGYEP
jgi:hypothetical protein